MSRSELWTEEQLIFCTAIPKIELHAHLNGSLRDSTVRELAEGNGIDPSLLRLVHKGDRTLAECFQLFGVIHSVTTTHAVIARITREVIEDCSADNVIYLELRTTPKERAEHGMTKESYTNAVLEGMQQAQAGTDIMVRLLLSIDRREDAAAARETVELAGRLQARGVVGIDLSGNPSLGVWETWLPALQRARELELKITLHAAEVYNPAETAAMMAFRPERFGHLCCLDDALERLHYAARVPVELCLSSNIMTQSVPSYPDHHFLPFYRAGHPIILCTDDSGVFSTSLSREYAIAAKAFGLSRQQLVELAEGAIDHTFLSAAEKAQLRDAFTRRKAEPVRKFSCCAATL